MSAMEVVLQPLRARRAIAVLAFVALGGLGGSRAWAADAVFDYEATTGAVTGDPGSTLRQRNDAVGETLRIVAAGDQLSNAVALGNPSPLSGSNSFVTSVQGPETALSFSLISGTSFDLSSILVAELEGVAETLTFSSDRGSVTRSLQGSASLSFAGEPAMQGITWFQISSSDGRLVIAFDDILLSDLRPRVSDLHIGISGASGNGGVYKVGDTVTASWDNSATGDANTGITQVLVDFSQFGGGTLAAANNGEVWSADYTLVEGTIEAANRNVTVSASRSGSPTVTADSSNATVDTRTPAAPLILVPANGSATKAASYSGTAELGTTVSITLDGTLRGSVTADALGAWSFTPATALTDGSHSMTATSTDTAGNTSVATASAFIVDTVMPTTPVGTLSVAENSAIGTVVGQVTATDTNAITYTLLDGAGGRFALAADGTVTVANGTLLDFETASSHFILVRVTDAASNVNGAIFPVDLTNVNEAPSFAAATLTTSEDVVSPAVSAVVTDVDSALHTIAIVTPPAHGSAGVVGNQLVYTPDANFNGNDSFSFSATDPGGLSVIGSAGVTVSGVNDAPTVVDATLYTLPATAVTSADLLAQAADVDGDALTLSAFTQGAQGAVTDDGNGRYTYTPAVGFTGSDSFSYTVSDGLGGSATGSVTVLVSADSDGDGLPDAFETAHGLNPNDAGDALGDLDGDGLSNAMEYLTGTDIAAKTPDALADAYETKVGGTLNVGALNGVLANDTDVSGNALTVQWVSGPAHAASFTLNSDGSFSYVQNGSLNAADSFDYRVSNGLDLSLTATASLSIPTSGPFKVLSLSPTSARLPEAGGAATFTVSNVSAAAVDITTASLTGSGYSINADGCTGVQLAAGASCTIGVDFAGSTSVSPAVLTIARNGSSEILSAFLTNREAVTEEARRRLPATLLGISGLPAQLTVGTIYAITWTMLSYDPSLKTMLVLFDCGLASECGASYGEATRLATSGYLSPSLVEAGSWSYSGQGSYQLSYSFDFTPSLAGNLVLRLYQKSGADEAAGKGGISSLIPGGLGEQYVGNDGRRLLRQAQ